MATQKELYSERLIAKSQLVANQVMDAIQPLTDEYFQLGYNSGGADPIIDADLSTYFNDLTAADVANIITAFQQLQNYFNNAAVTTADYSVNYNAVRNTRRV